MEYCCDCGKELLGTANFDRRCLLCEDRHKEAEIVIFDEFDKEAREDKMTDDREESREFMK